MIKKEPRVPNAWASSAARKPPTQPPALVTARSGWTASPIITAVPTMMTSDPTPRGNVISSLA